jgi:hypothetical protein
MNLNDLFVRWVSTFVASEVELTTKIQDALTAKLGQPVVVVLETDPEHPYAGLAPDGVTAKLRLNGRASATGVDVAVLQTQVADYFNSQQVEAVLQPGSGFLKMTIKIAGISLEDESAAPPSPEPAPAPAPDEAPDVGEAPTTPTLEDAAPPAETPSSPAPAAEPEAAPPTDGTEK